MGSKSHSPSRSASPHAMSKTPSSSGRRPGLMRASATAPSLATSNASRKDLASLQYTRAAALLTRVASYGLVNHDGQMVRTQRGDSIGSVCSSPEESRSPGSRDSDGKEWVVSQCGNYFSFPSFEDFEDYREEEERRSHTVT